ncbi:MAG: alpha/beta fold hydrolase, partial [Aestuariivirgaceae bacterium]
MSDLFPGFEQHTVAGDGADIHLRTGGSGPALLLLHGFPQTHAIWHRMAPVLGQDFTLVIPDLRGYGRSSCPVNSDDNYTYSKRAMGRDLLAVMTALGHQQFMICGHDRGGRVAYRMALDEPGRVSKLSLLDIVTT